MKTLYLTDSSANIYVDKDTNEVGTLRTEDRYDIRNIYYIEEPMHIVYKSGERTEEIDARKGDILLVFYSNRYNKYILDTIKTKQWAANIKNRRELEQKEKEEWAEKNSETPCCSCDGCCDCADLRPAEVIETPKKDGKLTKLKKMLKKVTKKA